jgi:Ser/Thr protein kinase RdoA (MazF antagonist)
MHDASSGFSRTPARSECTLQFLLDESLAMVAPWLDGSPDDVNTVHQIAETVRLHLVPVLPALDWGICHGDLSLDNLHMQPDGRLTLYDFDLSCYGWRAWDVCNALGYASPEHQDAFLRGYRSVRSFSPEEVAAVPYFMAADALRMMAAEVSRWAQWCGSARVDAWINEKLVWLRQWNRSHAG